MTKVTVATNNTSNDTFDVSTSYADIKKAIDKGALIIELDFAEGGTRMLPVSRIVWVQKPYVQPAPVAAPVNPDALVDEVTPIPESARQSEVNEKAE